MKISYLLPGIGKTGGNIVLYNFMDNLVKRGHEVYAILPKGRIKWEIGIWEEMMEKNEKFSFYSLLYQKSKSLKIEKIDRLIFIYSMKIMNEGLIKNWVKSDVTISTLCMTAYAGFFLSDKTVSLYHMQHYEELFFKNKYEQLMARNSYSFPLIQISNSKWLQDIIQKNLNKKSFLLNPGIDLSIFKPFKKIEEKYFPKKEWVMVSFFDEARDWKGFDDAVEAVIIAREHLNRRGIKLIWKLYGLKYPQKEYNTSFEYMGPIFGEELAKLYSEADLVLLTSWYESFPLPPIEAMACGSLVITTQYGTEDYVFHKENGLVSLPREIEDIGKNIVYAVENPSECILMVENGLKTVENYTWEERTNCLEEIIHESIANYSFDDYEFVKDLANGKFNKNLHDKFIE